MIAEKVLKYFLITNILMNSQVFGHKILGVFPGYGYSQFILCEKLMTELARRGHQVTVISTYKPDSNVRNYTTILLSDLLSKHQDFNFFLKEGLNPFMSDVAFHKMTLDATERILAHEKVQFLISSNETFDLVIVEHFGNEAHMGFAKHFNAPLVSFSSIGLTDWNSNLIGNVKLPSIVPMTFTSFSNKMIFIERLQNAVINAFVNLYKNIVYFPKQQQLLDKYFPEKMVLEDLVNNVSLILLSSDVATVDTTLLTNAAVEIGGFHIENKTLSSEIQTFLDEAEHGAIFFSMGSNLDAKYLPKGKMDAILRTFKGIKQRVLWKFGSADIPEKLENLYVSKWLPQVDILAHPNVVAFITHTGLGSTTESLFFGVPMIAIPIFGDQKMNCRRAVEKGVAVHLPFRELSEESLLKAIKEVFENPRYRKNAKKYSNIMRDRIAPPLDVAVHWINHILRFGGGKHLKNASMDLNWFQLYLLDVVSFLVLCFVLVIFVTKRLINIIISSKRIPKEKIKND